MIENFKYFLNEIPKFKYVQIKSTKENSPELILEFFFGTMISKIFEYTVAPFKVCPFCKNFTKFKVFNIIRTLHEPNLIVSPEKVIQN